MARSYNKIFGYNEEAFNKASQELSQKGIIVDVEIPEKIEDLVFYDNNSFSDMTHYDGASVVLLPIEPRGRESVISSRNGRNIKTIVPVRPILGKPVYTHVILCVASDNEEKAEKVFKNLESILLAGNPKVVSADVQDISAVNETW